MPRTAAVGRYEGFASVLATIAKSVKRTAATIAAVRSTLHPVCEADDVALRVGEERDRHRTRLLRLHDRPAAGLLDLRKRCLEIIRLDVDGEHALAVP